jgi:peptide/nickel transport system permease protein
VIIMQQDQPRPQVIYPPEPPGFFRSQFNLWRRRYINWRRLWRPLMESPIGLVGVVIIVLFALLALVQPLLLSTVWAGTVYDPIMGYDPEVQHPALPSISHPLGTDYKGRDVLSQLALATRTSFGVGIVAALVGTIVATTIGVASAYYLNQVDTVLMTMADVFIMLPPAVVLLSVGMLFEMSWYHVGLLYGVFAGLGSFAIMVKAHTLAIMTKQHILAARIAGGTNWRILRVHILPNLAALIMVNMMFIVTGSVMIEALLSYLDRTHFRLSWGSMIWQTIDNFKGAAVGLQWHVLLAPAIAIMLFCGAFYMVARTLDEVFNPSLRPR